MQYKRSLALITFPLAIATTLYVEASINSAEAQIVPDNTLGAESSVVNPDTIKGIPSDRIDGGATRGANLFHSFQQFNVGEGRGAYFSNPAAIENILSRVTGSNASNILGTLGVLGNANLFFINPNGIVFGANARLDMGGSFVGSTADSLVFENGFEFSASNPQAPPLLTVNIPIGLRFRDDPGDIVNSSVANDVGLAVAQSNNISLLGGDINLQGGKITAPGGIVELGGLSTSGTIGISEDGSLNFPEGVARSDISLTKEAAVNVRAGGGGFININAQNLSLSERSELFAGIAEGRGSEDAVAGDIKINATDSVKLIGNSIPSSLEVTAKETDNATGIRNNVGLSYVRRNDGSSISSAIGNGGSINIETGNLELINVAVLDTSIFGKGDAGNITIKADSVSLNQGFILTQVRGSDSEIKEKANGDGGDIHITANNIDLTKNSQVLADTKGQGNAGDITIKVTDTAFFDNTKILTQVQEDAEGDGGNIKISANKIDLTNKSQVLADSKGQGNAGNITIDVTDTASFDNTKILTQVQEDAEGNGGDIHITANNKEGAVGNGGDIKISANNIYLTKNSEILADSKGQGDAGNITIKVTDTASFDNTKILTQVQEGAEGNGGDIHITANNKEGAVGNGGDIKISANNIYLTKNFEILADSKAGNGGNVIIHASDNFTLSGDSFILTGIGKNSRGNAGKIDITAGSLEFNQTNSDPASLQSNAQKGSSGNAGDITIKVTDTASFDNTKILAQVEKGAEGNGGDIKISANNIDLTNNSEILADSKGQGDAGDITIKVADRASFDNTKILTQVQEGAEGNGGDIHITANNKEGAEGNGGDIKISANNIYLTNNSEILADSKAGNGGNVIIHASDNFTLSGDSFILTEIGKNSRGNAGNIDITAGSLDFKKRNTDIAHLQSNAQQNSSGNAGDITIKVADRASFDNTKILAQVEKGAEGNGGDIKISANNIDLTNNSEILADSKGQGDAGDITIKVADRASFDNTKILTQVQEDAEGNGGDIHITANNKEGAVGNGGDIKISANNIYLTKNSEILADSKGQGDAGNLNITATETISLDDNSLILSEVGKKSKGKAGIIDINAASIIVDNFSGISSSAKRDGKGNAANITIKSNNLRIANGAIVNAFTENQSDGGNIIINTDILDIVAGGKIVTATDSEGKAGNIYLKVTETIDIDGNNAPARPSDFSTDVDLVKQLDEQTGLFANTALDSIGGGGKVRIETGQLFVSNEAQISVESQGKGSAGNVNIEADTIALENRASLKASTPVGQGGNITLEIADDLTLRDNSTISARALNEANGGNLKIDARFIVAFPSKGTGNDIIATAEGGVGGKIEINAQQIFNLQKRDAIDSKGDFIDNDTNDIDASSRVDQSGVVEINQPDVDPSTGLIELPEAVVDPAALIAQNPCNLGLDSEFIIIGRGGLPPSPERVLSSDSARVDWVDLAPVESGEAEEQESRGADESNSIPNPQSKIHNQIVPARGWVLNDKGEAILVGYDPTNSGLQRSRQNPPTCPVP